MFSPSSSGRNAIVTALPTPGRAARVGVSTPLVGFRSPRALDIDAEAAFMSQPPPANASAALLQGGGASTEAATAGVTGMSDEDDGGGPGHATPATRPGYAAPQPRRGPLPQLTVDELIHTNDGGGDPADDDDGAGVLAGGANAASAAFGRDEIVEDEAAGGADTDAQATGFGGAPATTSQDAPVAAPLVGPPAAEVDDGLEVRPPSHFPWRHVAPPLSPPALAAWQQLASSSYHPVCQRSPSHPNTPWCPPPVRCAPMVAQRCGR